jgi:murein DD-endopeptidase MepM/ murein hydrolase activator NlpD
MRTRNIILVTVFLVIMGLIGFFSTDKIYNLPPGTAPFDDTLITSTPVIQRLYGIAVDSFLLREGIVKRNQTLGQIMEQYILPKGMMNQIVQYAGRVFDLTKIRSGNRYTAFLSPDTLQELRYLVYEHSPVDYVVFEFGDTLKVDVKQKEVVTKTKTATGRIKTSLWQSMTDADVNPYVAIELSEIYAWTIDFFGLQPEDSFSVVYDEAFVDTTSIGIADIHAAYFRHGGKDLYAIPFMQDSIMSFFDLEGKSLRRAFLKAPLRYSRISSRFSSGRMHPILRVVRAHYGVDYAAPLGTPVYTIGDGRVTSTGYESGEGNIVRITHNSVYSTSYMHLRAFAQGIRAGVYVKQGDLIGYVGSTGLSTGPHLDFRVYRNGSPIDPLKMESPPVDPVKPQYMAAFDSIKNIKLMELQAISIPQDEKETEKNIYSSLIKGILIPGLPIAK